MKRIRWKSAVNNENNLVDAIEIGQNVSMWLDTADKLLDSRSTADHKLAVKILAGLSLHDGLGDLSKTKPSQRILIKHLYKMWGGMKNRCSCETNPAYKWYGARGIRVCPQWLNFSSFAEWALANGYQRGLNIHRKDNDKGYWPDNCQWLTRIEHGKQHGRRKAA